MVGFGDLESLGRFIGGGGKQTSLYFYFNGFLGEALEFLEGRNQFWEQLDIYTENPYQKSAVQSHRWLM